MENLAVFDYSLYLSINAVHYPVQMHLTVHGPIGEFFLHALCRVVVVPNIEQEHALKQIHLVLTGFPGQRQTYSRVIATLAQVIPY